MFESVFQNRILQHVFNTMGLGLGQKFEWTKVRVDKYFVQIIFLFPLMNILYDEGQDSKPLTVLLKIYKFCFTRTFVHSNFCPAPDQKFFDRQKDIN